MRCAASALCVGRFLFILTWIHPTAVPAPARPSVNLPQHFTFDLSADPQLEWSVFCLTSSCMPDQTTSSCRWSITLRVSHVKLSAARATKTPGFHKQHEDDIWRPFHTEKRALKKQAHWKTIPVVFLRCLLSLLFLVHTDNRQSNQQSFHLETHYHLSSFVTLFRAVEIDHENIIPDHKKYHPRYSHL